jgi:hypothetical protein
MKTRAVIAGLAILMVVFCLAAPSQATKSNRHNINFMPPADEHPWQESGAPFDDDEILPLSAPPLVFVIWPTNVVIIRGPIRLKEAARVTVDRHDPWGDGFGVR